MALILCIFPASSSQTVYLTESGRCYHRRDCQYVIGKDNTVTVTEQQAKDSRLRRLHLVLRPQQLINSVLKCSFCFAAFFILLTAY